MGQFDEKKPLHNENFAHNMLHLLTSWITVAHSSPLTLQTKHIGLIVTDMLTTMNIFDYCI